MRLLLLLALFTGAAITAEPRVALADTRDDDRYDEDDRHDDDDSEDDDDRDDDRDRARDRGRDRDTPPDWTRDKRGRARKYLPVREGKEPPPGYEESTRPIVGLIVPGAILLPVAWAASSLTSLTCGIVQLADSYTRGCRVDDAAWGVMPLVGPFIVATARGTEPGWRAGYALYGAFQNAGLAMVIIGASIQRDVWVLTPEAQHEERKRTSIFVGPGTVGLRGSF